MAWDESVKIKGGCMNDSRCCATLVAHGVFAFVAAPSSVVAVGIDKHLALVESTTGSL
jgi:hypothetical protein